MLQFMNQITDKHGWEYKVRVYNGKNAIPSPTVPSSRFSTMQSHKNGGPKHFKTPMQTLPRRWQIIVSRNSST